MKKKPTRLNSPIYSYQFIIAIISRTNLELSSGDNGRLPETIKEVTAGLSQKMMSLLWPRRDGRSHVKDPI